MQVLIQSSATSKYLGRNRWTREEMAAIDFKKVVCAVEHCVHERLADVQLVLKFGEDPELDITLPLRIPQSTSLRATQASLA